MKRSRVKACIIALGTLAFCCFLPGGIYPVSGIYESLGKTEQSVLSRESTHRSTGWDGYASAGTAFLMQGNDRKTGLISPASEMISMLEAKSDILKTDSMKAYRADATLPQLLRFINPGRFHISNKTQFTRRCNLKSHKKITCWRWRKSLSNWEQRNAGFQTIGNSKLEADIKRASAEAANYAAFNLG